MKTYCKVDLGKFSTPALCARVLELEESNVKARRCFIIGEEEYLSSGNRFGIRLSDVSAMLTGLILDGCLLGEVESLDTPLGQVYAKRSRFIKEHGSTLDPKACELLRPKLVGAYNSSKRDPNEVDQGSIRIAAWTLAVDYDWTMSHDDSVSGCPHCGEG